MTIRKRRPKRNATSASNVSARRIARLASSRRGTPPRLPANLQSRPTLSFEADPASRRLNLYPSLYQYPFLLLLLSSLQRRERPKNLRKPS